MMQARRSLATRPHFDRTTEPVLMHHGSLDEQCPPRWAPASLRAMREAGVDAQLEWYEGEGHAFSFRFADSMARTVDFLERRLGRPGEVTR